MIKHRKIIICFLLSYALFIVGIFNVRAETISNYWTFSGFTDKDWYFNKYNASVGPYSNTYNNLSWNSWDFPPNAKSFTFQFYLVNKLYNHQGTLTCVQEDSGVCYVYQFENTLDIQMVYGGQLCKANIYNNSSGPSYLQYTCPINGVNRSGLWYAFTNLENSTQYFDYGFSYHISFEIDNNLATANNTGTIANNTGQINSNITDSSIDNNNTSSSTSSWGNKNASNGTITNLLTLPISLLQAIVNGIQSSCSSFSLGSLFGTNIILPCINIGSLIGSALWSTIDILFSGFMILAIAKKLIKIFNDFTNLKTNQIDELYGGGK